MLDPERAVLVEGGDAFLGRDKIRAAGFGGGFDRPAKAIASRVMVLWIGFMVSLGLLISDSTVIMAWSCLCMFV